MREADVSKSMTWPEYCAIAGQEATVPGFREMRQKSRESDDGSKTKLRYYYADGGMGSTGSWFGWLR